VQFTFFWPEATRWECVDFHVNVEQLIPESVVERSVG
jgi:hypothetical protein